MNNAMRFNKREEAIQFIAYLASVDLYKHTSTFGDKVTILDHVSDRNAYLIHQAYKSVKVFEDLPSPTKR